MNQQSQTKHLPNPLQRGLSRVANTMRELIGARQGAIGVALALLFVPTVMVVGAAVDYARLEQFKTQLQATVDSAALSGAAAYADASSGSAASTVATNYLTSNEGLLPAHIGTITNTVTPTNVTSGSNQGYTVSVKATATIGTTFMRMITSTMTVSASATAVNPLVSITLTATNFKSDAGDGNTLYYWLVSGSSPNAQPTVSGFTASQKLASNVAGSTNKAVTFTATATQQIGIALQNVTGENADYGCTQYQTAPTSLQWNANQRKYVTVTSSCAGTTQWFFSNMMPPSNNTYNSSSIDTGYTSVTTNCSVQVSMTATLPTVLTPPISGSCSTSLPTYAYPSCSQINGQYVTFYWNDMGGNSDDKDYNDAEISLSCTGSGNTATTVYLSS